ncbi:MAG: hypothetical protein HY849_07635 [Nitrosomonadales bacterium]|nr:hypothetical protein [Nitrosomonadales bacterium]
MSTFALSATLRVAALRWQMRRMAGELGTPGVIGIGVLTFAVMYGYSTIIPEQQELIELKQRAAQSRAVTQTPTRPDPAQTLQVQPQTFPARTELLTWLDRLHQAAVANHLVLDLGEYKLGAVSGSLQTYEINFPVKTDYAQLRGFLSQALSDNPGLSLDEISFRRQKVSDAQLDARVRMTIYLRAD